MDPTALPSSPTFHDWLGDIILHLKRGRLEVKKHGERLLESPMLSNTTQVQHGSLQAPRGGAGVREDWGQSAEPRPWTSPVDLQALLRLQPADLQAASNWDG